MRSNWATIAIAAILLVQSAGCQTRARRAQTRPAQQTPISAGEIEPVAFEEETLPPANDAAPTELLPLPATEPTPLVSPEQLRVHRDDALALQEVVASIRSHFPLIRQAAAARGIASGETLSAAGAFDHKLEADSTSQPLDFYENYRQSIGVKRDTMWGGETFAGYRIGRGFFEPWYLERETNKGGEFKAGFMAPLVRDRWIDSNRAALWQAELEQRRVEPEIMAQVIRFVRDGSVAYWNWGAAGAEYRIAEGLLELAQKRNAGLEEQVRAEEKAEIDLVDNRRIIFSREAKLIDSRRKLEQAAIKLSLFYRSSTGQPLITDSTLLPPMFDPAALGSNASSELGLEAEDIETALAQRPELSELQVVRRQLGVALRQAENETWPDVDGGLLVAQDVGAPTSAKRDKSELKLEALITVTVPLERRKALGKVRSLRWKLAQVRAKNQFAADKITAEVQLARAALAAAREKVSRAVQSYELALQMQAAEQELFDQGQSTLFNVNIREQQAAEAASARVQAFSELFLAQADYAAALGYQGPVG